MVCLKAGDYNARRNRNTDQETEFRYLARFRSRSGGICHLTCRILKNRVNANIFAHRNLWLR